MGTVRCGSTLDTAPVIFQDLKMVLGRPRNCERENGRSHLDIVTRTITLTILEAEPKAPGRPETEDQELVAVVHPLEAEGCPNWFVRAFQRW